MSNDKEQSQPTRTKRFIQSWLINTLAVLVASQVVPGIHIEKNSLLTPFVTALILGILNYFIRPIMMLLALPLLIFTLGLFTLVINAALLYFVGSLPKLHFVVDSFWAAFLGAVIISIVSVTLQIMTGTGKSRITFTRGQRPPPGPGNDDKGGGPVIDV